MMKIFRMPFCFFLVTSLVAGMLLPASSQESISFEKVPVRYPTPWQFPDQLELTVVDEREQPVADANVTVMAKQSSGIARMVPDNLYVKKYKTDSQGKALIVFDELAEKYFFTQLAIDVSADNESVPTTAFYCAEQGTQEIIVPDKITATWKPGDPPTCQVVDEQGNGIEGVEVTWAFRDPYNWQDHGMLGRVYLNREFRFQTDPDGYFSLILTAQHQDIGDAVSLTLKHPDYQPQQIDLTRLGHNDPLKMITLLSAKKVAVRVLDEDRNPVSGAIVEYPVTIKKNTSIMTPTTTDDNGMFAMSVSPDQTTIRVHISAKGMQTQHPVLKIEDSTATPDIILRKGNPIRIQAVDEKGNVIPGIMVRFYYGFQHETPILDYGTPRENLRFGSYHPINAQLWENDTWEWSDGAQDEYFVDVRVMDKGIVTHVAEQPFYPVRPREEPYLVKMREFKEDMSLPSTAWQIIPQMRIRVVDYETGLPCEKTQVTMSLGKTPSSSLSSAAWLPLVQKDYATNEKGEIGLDFGNILPANVDHFSLVFQKEGYYSKSYQWSSAVLRNPYSPAMAAPPRHLEERYGPPVPELLEIALVRKGQEDNEINEE